MYCIVLGLVCLLFLHGDYCNVSVKHNGGLPPDIILLIQCYNRRGTRLNAMKRFGLCSLQSHLNVLTFPPPTGGCSEGSPICNTVLQHFSCNMVDAIKTTPRETLF